jgi:cytochrome b6-f complex iron-sulfur subunit
MQSQGWWASGRRLLWPWLASVATLRLSQHAAPRRVTRRSFLRNVVLGGVGVVLLEIAGGFVYFVWPNKVGAFGSKVTVPKSSLPAVGADPYVNVAGKFYIINNSDGGLALYWKCVHLGCTVPWNKAEGHFHCPCHGSVYDRHGNRIAGPAPRALDIMDLSLDPNGNAIVNTGKITSRAKFEPAQAVKLT